MNGHTNPARSRERTMSEAGLGDQVLPFQEHAAWSDEALMAAVAARDEQAFAALYDRYADLVFSASLRVLGDRQLAEDAAQDIFVRIWQRPESFVATRGRFMSWLMSVTRNRSVDEVRSRGRRQRRETGGLDDEGYAPSLSASHENEPLQAAQVQERQHHVREALEGLPREQRQVLELAYFGGLTQQEIAASLHEPLGTVKTRIRLGMQKLRSALADEH